MMTMHEDTIASVATALGVGAIGIVRISGRLAFEIAQAIFIGKKKSFLEIQSHSMAYGWIVDPSNGEKVDEVLISKMKKPHTYTREDVVEIHSHGSLIAIKSILEIACRNGARLAEPGEFTKRAFLNGRIDLSQAEAVMDIIHARASAGLKASVEQLEGRLSKEMKKVRNRLIDMLSHIEANVDYPEYEIEEVSKEEMLEGCGFVLERLDHILQTFDKGRILREGLAVVIVGVPNVGKSSLLNRLLGKERAIVTDIPGTTRDVIEEHLELAGIEIKLIDTAGIRNTEDVVENIGVGKSLDYIEKADLILFMVDATKDLSEDDFKVFEQVKDKKTLLILNKMDQADENRIHNMEKVLDYLPHIKMSVLHEKGFSDLEDFIQDHFIKGNLSTNGEFVLTNIRHKLKIEDSIKSINDAIMALKAQMPLDIFSIDIKNTAEHLGMITGESIAEDVYHAIFQKFCIGK
jgi:tRNA modification GTPase